MATCKKTTTKAATKVATKETPKVAAKAAPAPAAKKTTARKPRKTAAEVAATPAPVAETPRKEPVTLTVQAEVGSKVYLAGSFNNWEPGKIEMTDKDGTGIYTVSIELAPGVYEYKFIINGIWSLDPDPDRDWTQNGLGTLNSVIRV